MNIISQRASVQYSSLLLKGCARNSSKNETPTDPVFNLPLTKLFSHQRPLNQRAHNMPDGNMRLLNTRGVI